MKKYYLDSVDEMYANVLNGKIKSISPNNSLSLLKKRKLDPNNLQIVPNLFKKMTVKGFLNISGKMNYGAEISVDLLTENNLIMEVSIPLSKFMEIMRDTTIVNGEITEKFKFEFYGQLEELFLIGSESHKNLLDKLNEQNLKIQSARNLENVSLNIGDVIPFKALNKNSIYQYISNSLLLEKELQLRQDRSLDKVAYLGDFYYAEPNFKKENLYNNPSKFKVFIEVDSEFKPKEFVFLVKNIKNTENFTVLGKCSENHMATIEKAKIKMDSIFEREVGFISGKYYHHNFYSTPVLDRYYPLTYRNKSIYILANMSLYKENFEYKSKDEILKYLWACDFDIKISKRDFPIEFNVEKEYLFTEKDIKVFIPRFVSRR